MGFECVVISPTRTKNCSLLPGQYLVFWRFFCLFVFIPGCSSTWQSLTRDLVNDVHKGMMWKLKRKFAKMKFKVICKCFYNEKKKDDCLYLNFWRRDSSCDWNTFLILCINLIKIEPVWAIENYGFVFSKAWLFHKVHGELLTKAYFYTGLILSGLSFSFVIDYRDFMMGIKYGDVIGPNAGPLLKYIHY